MNFTYADQSPGVGHLPRPVGAKRSQADAGLLAFALKPRLPPPPMMRGKKWDEDEDKYILEERKRGQGWRQIATALPGRSDDAVRNRYHRLAGTGLSLPGGGRPRHPRPRSYTSAESVASPSCATSALESPLVTHNSSWTAPRARLSATYLSTGAQRRMLRSRSCGGSSAATAGTRSPSKFPDGATKRFACDGIG